MIDKLLVYPEAMKANLERLGGLVHSRAVLLALTQAGVSREDAYRLVQRNAMKVWQKGGAFLDKLGTDEDVTAYLSKAALADLFEPDRQLGHVETLFARVFASG